MNYDMSEKLARDVREALGPFNDDAEPVVACVRKAVAELKRLNASRARLAEALIDVLDAPPSGAVDHYAIEARARAALDDVSRDQATITPTSGQSTRPEAACSGGASPD